MVIIFGLLASISTFLGGLFALKFKDKLHLILGFSAGAVIGVAFFDLLPEAFNLAEKTYTHEKITLLIAVGFLAYLVLDRIFFLRFCHGGECENPQHRGQLGAGTLSVHSFLDGLAIGLAFQVAQAIGLVVTLAVLTHDFSDGINTVSLILKNRGTKKDALRWLALDAIAPTVGVLATLFIRLPEQALGLLLAIFCGFFLYIGASDLLPESHHSHPTKGTTIMTILGVLVLYAVIKLAG